MKHEQMTPADKQRAEAIALAKQIIENGVNHGAHNELARAFLAEVARADRLEANAPRTHGGPNCVSAMEHRMLKDQFNRLAALCDKQHEDLGAARAQIKELEHEKARDQILIKIADELITNDIARADWENAKRTRVM